MDWQVQKTLLKGRPYLAASVPQLYGNGPAESIVQPRFIPYVPRGLKWVQSSFSEVFVVPRFVDSPVLPT